MTSQTKRPRGPDVEAKGEQKLLSLLLLRGFKDILKSFIVTTGETIPSATNSTRGGGTEDLASHHTLWAICALHCLPRGRTKTTQRVKDAKT